MNEKPKRWLTKEEQKLWRAFLNAQFRLNKILNFEIESSAGFDLLTYEIFVHLSEQNDRTLRMKELAKCVSATKSKLSYRVAQLEKEGYLNRSHVLEDGRGQNCILTDKGLNMLKKSAPLHVDGVLDNFIEPLKDTNIQELTEVFNSIAKKES